MLDLSFMKAAKRIHKGSKVVTLPASKKNLTTKAM